MTDPDPATATEDDYAHAWAHDHWQDFAELGSFDYAILAYKAGAAFEREHLEGVRTRIWLAARTDGVEAERKRCISVVRYHQDAHTGEECLIADLLGGDTSSNPQPEPTNTQL